MPTRFRTSLATLGLAALASVLTGCGGSPAASPPVAANTAPASPSSPESAPAEAITETPAAPVVLPVHAASSPEEVVLAFLNAMRDGNSGIAGGLLTDQAQAETTKHQWSVQPPGAPSATYQLGTPAYADATQSVVHVPCLWSETDEAGGSTKFEVTWALRKLDAGWRVAGFATEVVPGQPPYFFNFEDIANLKETEAAAEAAMTAAMQQAEGAAATIATEPARDQPLKR